MQAAKRPFEGFYIAPDFVMALEVKLLKDYAAFNFNKIRPHQIENLTRIHAVNPDVLTLIILGIWIPRKVIELFFFHIDFINRLRATGKNSLHKRELIDLIDEGRTLQIIKQSLPVDKIREKVIWQ